MKFIVCEQPGSFKTGKKEVPSIGHHDALLSIKTIGVCGTDLHAYAGNQAFFSYPRILGHELGAQVVQTGEMVNKVKVGDKVAIMPYISCGKCIACRNGKTNCCTQMQVLGVHKDGGMQEQIAVPANLLLEVNDLSYEEIAIIEPLAIGAHAIRRASIKPGEFVVVIGCGPIGLGIMKFAQSKGARVIAIDIVPSRLAFAKKQMGVDFIVNTTEEPISQVAAITDGDLATAVFDATGHKQALESGPDYMAHGGRYVLVGLFKDQLSFHHPSIHAKETTIMCSRNATLEDFEQVIKMLRKGQFPTKSFITHQVKFDQVIQTFESWLDPKTNVIKAMIRM